MPSEFLLEVLKAGPQFVVHVAGGRNVDVDLVDGLLVLVGQADDAGGLVLQVGEGLIAGGGELLDFAGQAGDAGVARGDHREQRLVGVLDALELAVDGREIVAAVARDALGEALTLGDEEAHEGLFLALAGGGDQGANVVAVAFRADDLVVFLLHAGQFGLGVVELAEEDGEGHERAKREENQDRDRDDGAG